MAERVPGVYIREIQTLPPSVAPVATAIPAFIGYTQLQLDDNGSPITSEDNTPVIRRITNLLEYEKYFGREPKLVRFQIRPNGNRYEFRRLADDGTILTSENESQLHARFFYYAIQWYFANGGGPCYIVSVGRYSNDNLQESEPSVNNDEITAGINILAERDEPTLLVMPEAVLLPTANYYSRCVDILSQCNDLKDRFGVFDLLSSDPEGAAFRNATGINYLNYGAVYTPNIRTDIAYQYRDRDVEVGDAFFVAEAGGDNGIRVLISELDPTVNSLPALQIRSHAQESQVEIPPIEGALLIINRVLGDTGPQPTYADFQAAWENLEDHGGFEIAFGAEAELVATVEPNDDPVDFLPPFYEFRHVDEEGNGLLISCNPPAAVGDQTPGYRIVVDADANEIAIVIDNLVLEITLPTDSTIAEVLTAWDGVTEPQGFYMTLASESDEAAVVVPTELVNIPSELSTIFRATSGGLTIEYISNEAPARAPSFQIIDDAAATAQFAISADGLALEIRVDANNADELLPTTIVDAWNGSQLSSNFSLRGVDGNSDPVEVTGSTELSTVPTVYRATSGSLIISYSSNEAPDGTPSFQIIDDAAATAQFALLEDGLRLQIRVNADNANELLPATIVDAWDNSDLLASNFSLTQDGTSNESIELTLRNRMVSLEPVYELSYPNAAVMTITYRPFNQNADSPTISIREGGATVGFSIARPENARPHLTVFGVGADGVPASSIVSAWRNYAGEKTPFVIQGLANQQGIVQPANYTFARGSSLTLADIESDFTQVYNQFKTELSQKYVVLPPSPGVVGQYASVDRDRGVWKAPANVSLRSVVEPIRNITNEQQGRLNEDPTSGKSINAIRSFTGKGTLIWGARTLAGNDNEWRYINVRRLFIFIEESIQKATAFVVFESNNATTWLKVKGLIESFLYSLWQQGALAGPTSDAAYFVNVGLGKTMTPDDILRGRMIVDVGIAAVRPAEFIILRFSHKLQEA